jgi:hypothetical protein
VTSHSGGSWRLWPRLVANLSQVADDPESVVADLLVAEDAINQGVPG